MSEGTKTTVKTTVMIVDDHAVVREGIAKLLEHSGDFRVVGQAADSEFRVQGEAARRLFAGMTGTPAPIPPSDLDRLTAREREILRMFAQGMSYAEISEAGGNNPMTVRNAVYAIQKKLGLGSRQEMRVWAACSGLLDDNDLL